MRFAITVLSAALFLPALVPAADPADNWPQWRGPHLNGSSEKAAGLAVRWSESRNVAWRTKLPSWSAASPVVWEDTIFVTSAEEGFTNPKGRGFVGAALGRIASALN